MVIQLLVALSLLLLVSVPAGAAEASPETVGMDAARLARIPARMRAFVAAQTAAGFVTLVARRGEIVALDAVGQQDIEAGRPMREDSIFQVASMTKPITVAAVMMLVEEGRLALTDPVEEHLPEFRGMKLRAARDPQGRETLVPPSRPVNIRDLMTHTSGMAGGFPEPLRGIFSTRDRTLAEAVRIYAQQPLIFEPGTRWQYSNMGIATLGRIIEVISGQPYERFLAARIFEPLGMNDSFIYPPEQKYGRIAAIYHSEEGRLRRADIDLHRKGARYPAPEGGLYSTARDLFAFYQAMLNGGEFQGARILSPASVEEMTRLHTGELRAGFAPGMGYGLGFSVVRNAEGTFRLNSIGTYGHGGAWRTYGFVDPRKELIGVILFQRVGGGGDLAAEINAFIAMANAAIVE